MAQLVSDCLRTMRLAIGRRNVNDPDSNDLTLLTYINDFVSLAMSNDVKLFEQYGTLTFDITPATTTGVYTFNDVKATIDFINISQEAFITLKAPAEKSISWNRLYIYQDPGIFFQKWGVNNSEILVAGYPTEMLYYGNELTFRTIPNDNYTVYIYGYKINPEFTTVDEDGKTVPDSTAPLPFDFWMRYIAYGAALDYARDYRFEANARAMLEKDFAHERKLLLTKTHNQVKHSRPMPSF